MRKRSAGRKSSESPGKGGPRGVERATLGGVGLRIAVGSSEADLKRRSAFTRKQRLFVQPDSIIRKSSTRHPGGAPPPPVPVADGDGGGLEIERTACDGEDAKAAVGSLALTTL